MQGVVLAEGRKREKGQRSISFEQKCSKKTLKMAMKLNFAQRKLQKIIGHRIPIWVWKKNDANIEHTQTTISKKKLNFFENAKNLL